MWMAEKFKEIQVVQFLKNYFLNFFCIYLLLEKLINKKYFSVKKKFDLVSRKMFTFLCLFVIRKVSQQKIFSSQRKIWLDFQESVFLKNLGGKHFFENYEKFRNVILFADYIKFNPQTFDCYIYFVLNIYFLISSLKI